MKRYKWSIVIVLIQLALALYLGMQLSDEARVPSHWNIKGEIDGYVGKWSGIFLFPALNGVILLVFILLPLISVRFQTAEARFNKILPTFCFIMILFFAGIHIYSLLLALNVLSPQIKVILILLGLMVILLGNLLPKLPSNFFVGIRTPWTLSSEVVWRKTHRIGAICFILSGLIMIFIPLLWRNSTTAIIITFILFFLLIFYSVLYSFLLFQKEKKEK
ncbi:MAG: hypothetical protein APR54_12685 [Candidatus Cloacimonas sp. SDB]|nr:MAG: hypothetical protein APR54_12685 [Candidatus Cloacimonas sp. SDB]